MLWLLLGQLLSNILFAFNFNIWSRWLCLNVMTYRRYPYITKGQPGADDINKFSVLQQSQRTVCCK